MINTNDLKLLLEKYNINADKVLKKNFNVIEKCKYQEMKAVLEYLKNILNINSSNIEKCPSILYTDINIIKTNYEFLINNLNNYDIETCLHILNTEPDKLKETYNFVVNKYGKKVLNKITSILKVDIKRIKKI